MLGEIGGHMANHVITGKVFIKKVCKQLFLTQLIMEIILKEGQSRTKSYLEVQKDQ